MEQKVEYINIQHLVLWTENPRDPIDENAIDQDIVDRALEDKRGQWNLSKLAKEMGDYYDFSELPTIVYHGDKPVVYDGNRRIILGKIKNNLVKASSKNIELPDIPKDIPCNICDKETALNNILRKHGGSGTWSTLDRDIFLHKFMQKPKSYFLKLEEATGIISKNPELNKGFVKDEIFNQQTLRELGFDFVEDKLMSRHNTIESQAILEDIKEQIINKNISTRNNRGQILSLLTPDNQEYIRSNKNKAINEVKLEFSQEPKSPRTTKRVKKTAHIIFGANLYLKPGDVSNLYRDIVDLHIYYKSNKNISSTFSVIIRMSLRLICEMAANDLKLKMDQYLKSYFTNAKKMLDQDQKTSLSNQNINEGSIAQLLHTGAHGYTSSNNFDQTLAISFILGSILTLSHGKEY